LERFVAADPEDRWSRLALAENNLRISRPHEAESVVAGLPQQDHWALIIRLRAALDAQDEERAQRLLALGRSDDPKLARFRGRLALWRRDAPSALREFRLAYTADPEDRDTIYGLLNALVMVGDEAAAQPLRQIAGRLDRLNALVQRAGTAQGRQDPTLMRRIGSACAALNRHAEARAWYKLAITRDPLDSEAQQALFQLDTADRDEPRVSRPAP
jgi:tetratricopeptide (TPR) repeat protein